MPLSWNNIRWNTGNLLFPVRITEKQAGRITVNYGWTDGGSDIRKFPGIILSTNGNYSTTG